MWFRGVTVSTLDSESSNPSSNLGGTLFFFNDVLALREALFYLYTKKSRFKFVGETKH